MIYAYCRVSTQTQNIDRQVENILRLYPNAKIYKESFTGRSLDRPEWNKLRKLLQAGDTIVFDEVSRLSRSAEDGMNLYEELFLDSIELIFIKEQHLSTAVYKEAIKNTVSLTGTSIDCILEGINQYLLTVAKEQVRLAFVQAEKEVDFLRQRTREGIREAKARGSQIGAPKGSHFITKKSLAVKEIIKKHSKAFGGSLSDKEVMAIAKCSRNAYYKYKSELTFGVS